MTTRKKQRDAQSGLVVPEATVSEPATMQVPKATVSATGNMIVPKANVGSVDPIVVDSPDEGVVVGKVGHVPSPTTDSLTASETDTSLEPDFGRFQSSFRVATSSTPEPEVPTTSKKGDRELDENGIPVGFDGLHHMTKVKFIKSATLAQLDVLPPQRMKSVLKAIDTRREQLRG
jgi:hypothetical protein